MSSRSAPRLGLAMVGLVAACSSTPETTPADVPVLLARAREHLDRKEAEAALPLVRAAGTAATDRREREDALYLETDVLHRLGRLESSFEAAKRFAQEFPISRHLPDLETLLFEVGLALLQGAEGGFLGIPRALGLALDGTTVLRYLKEVSPNGKYAVDVHRVIAQYHFDRAEFEAAATEYETLVDDHPGSAWQPLAEYRIALCRLKHSRGARYDREILEKAKKGFQDYEQRHPNTRYVELARVHAKEVHNMLAEKSFRIGDFYLSDQRTEASVFYFKRTIIEYPETAWARQSRERLEYVAEAYVGTEAGTAARAYLELTPRP